MAQDVIINTVEYEGIEQVNLPKRGGGEANFIEAGIIPHPSDANPLMDGSASAGSSNDYSRADHVHPSDSTKANASETYTKTEMDTALSGKANASAVYTKTETDTLLSGKASASDLDALEEEMADYKQMYLDSLIHTTASGSIASFSDGFDNAPMDFCTATIEPVQDLHGQSNPYPAGGGKNKFGDYTIVNAYITSDGVITSSSNDRIYIFKAKPNTDYGFLITRVIASGSTLNDDYAIAEYTGETAPTAGSTGTRLVSSGYIRPAGSTEYTLGKGTFTTGADTTWLAIKLANISKTDATATANNTTFEESSTVPTAWSPYENICSISGWTGAEVVRTGSNLCEGFRVFSDSNCIIDPLFLKAGQYTVAFSGRGSVNAIYLRKGEVVSLSGDAVSQKYNTNNFTFTIDVDGYYFIQFYRNSSTPTWTDSPIVNAWINYGSTASDYEDYNGNTYSVTWESEAGTVYGGSVDLVSGVLTVTHGYIASYNGETLPSTWISDRDVYAEGTTPTIGAEVVYELAEPITYQLTPQEIKTLFGSNNVWADTGDTSVGYVADTKLYIDSKLS